MIETERFSPKKRPAFASRLFAPVLIVALSIAVGVVNMSIGYDKTPWAIGRIEFNPVDMIESPHGEKFRGDFAPAVFWDKLSATEYLCVDESSIYYPYLSIHQELTGFEIDSTCTPLDFTDRPGDNLHPKLVTATVAKESLYYAFVPGFEPTSNTAVLVEAHGDVFVLVNIDTLHHLGLGAEVPS